MTLKDDDILTTRVQTRRSLLVRLGAVAGVALALVTGSQSAEAADARDFIPADNKARSPHDQNTRSGDVVAKKPKKGVSKTRDARDFIPADNKARNPHDQNTRSGDSVGG